MKNGKENIKIRPPKMSDLNSLLSMINTLVKEKAMITIQKKQTRKQEKEYLENAIKKIKKGKLYDLVIDIDGKVMGQAAIFPMDDDSKKHIGDIGIAIRKEVRGKGLGKELFLKTIEGGIKKFGFKIIFLYVFSENKIARKMYSKLGFKEIGTIKKGVSHYGKMMDSIIMVKYI